MASNLNIAKDPECDDAQDADLPTRSRNDTLYKALTPVRPASANIPKPGFVRCLHLRAVMLACLLVAAFNLGSLAIAQDSNCDNSTVGDPIHCVEDSTSTDNIDIDITGVAISTSGDSESGISARHLGSGAIGIDVTGTSGKHTITTTGSADSRGVDGLHEGSGKININVRGVSISTSGERGTGISARHLGSDGNINIDLGSNTEITTSGGNASGVLAYDNVAGDSDIMIRMTGGTITTSGAGSKAIHATRVDSSAAPDNATGSIDITLNNSTLKTTSTDSTTSGIQVQKQIAGEGDISVTLQNTTVSTMRGHGLTASQHHEGTGDLTLSMNGGSITAGGDNAIAIYGESGGSGKIDIDVKNGALTADSASSKGISASRGGTGDIEIDVDRGSTIATGGEGIYAGLNNATSTSAINIRLDAGSTVSTTANEAHGITTLSLPAGGKQVIKLSGASSITTGGIQAHGINARHNGASDIQIDIANGNITTESTAPWPAWLPGQFTLSHGVLAEHRGTGNIDIDARAGSTLTKGFYSYGIRGDHRGSGVIQIDTYPGHRISTSGDSGHGIVAYHYGTADTRSMDITVGGPVTVSGADAQGVRVGTVSSGAPARMAALDDDGYRRQTVTVNGPITSAAEGVFLANGGRVIIGPRGSITSGSGIAILATGTVPAVADDMNTPENEAMPAIPPKLRVDLNLGGRRVAQAIGDNGWIINDGGQTTIAMNNVVLHDGATGVVLDGNDDPLVVPNGAWDVSMLASGVKVTDRTNADPAMWVVSDRAESVIADRDFSSADFTESRVRCPAGQIGFPNCRTPPPPEPEPEMYQVDEPVAADASALAGVHVEGNGAVHIGAQGSLRAASGIAILATGEKPDLLVDMDLDGRQVADVIGDDWIINDGGGTTIVVNGVTLHDGTTGVVPGASAPNGAREVQMQAEAGAVRAQTGDVRIREAGVRVLDRTDLDPANWVVSEPAEGVIADRDFSAADFISGQEGAAPQPPGFVEEYAPRAALYEALPDFLLRLTGPGPNRRCRSAPEERAWVRFAGGQGAYDADRSTTGATYTLDRFETEGGFSAAFNDTTRGWVSVRHLWGTAGVGSPTGGGKIDVRGLGASVGGAWQSPTGAYALGCFAYMRYNVDFASNQRGLLKAGTNARANTLDFETGWRVALTEVVQWAPRVWVVGSRVAVDGFTDAVDARVAYADAARIRGGLGFVGDTTRPWGEGTVTLRGSVDLEKLLSGRETRVAVSGESLRALATAHGLLVGLNGVYRHGRFSIGAEVAVRQELGSNDSEYASFLNLGVRW